MINDPQALVDDRVEEGLFRVDRKIFHDPDIFELEMRNIFESGWVFLGLTSQAAQPHDFFTAHLGRVQAVMMRGVDGILRAFVNSCPHKGAQIAQTRCGNARLHVCPYHSWSFDSSGQNRGIKWENAGCYSDAFLEQHHGLAPLPRFESYRGFLFGSLVDDVCSLEDHLGEAARLLDLVVGQPQDGAELVPGDVTYTFEANWKLQLENCSDAYHFTSVHPSYVHIMERRRQLSDDEAAGRSIWDEAQAWSEDAQGVQGGSISFANGHVLNWGRIEVSPGHPLLEQADVLASRHGKQVRDWMFNMRNLTIFPNLQIAENASSQLRVIQPIAPGRTLMRTWCIAPKGESANARRQRIRQYEDFFNPSGMATPDDTVAYESCQRGFAAAVEPWLQGYGRGMTASQHGGNELTDMIVNTPERSVLSDARLCDETLYHAYYREWARRMAKEVAGI